MDIFIGNLPVPDGDGDADALVGELRAAMGAVARKLELALFLKKPSRGQTYCYAVVSTPSPRLGSRVLHDLAGKSVRDQRLLPRAHLPRAASNDRRAIDWRTRDWRGTERRTGERRCFKDTYLAGWQAEQRERRWSAAFASRLRGLSLRRMKPVGRKRR